MSIKVYVPCDAAALSMGADEVADAITAHGGDKVQIIRNGSRGMFWLCLLYTSPSPRDLSTSRMPSSA